MGDCIASSFQVLNVIYCFISYLGQILSNMIWNDILIKIVKLKICKVFFLVSFKSFTVTKDKSSSSYLLTSLSLFHNINVYCLISCCPLDMALTKASCLLPLEPQQRYSPWKKSLMQELIHCVSKLQAVKGFELKNCVGKWMGELQGYAR